MTDQYPSGYEVWARKYQNCIDHTALLEQKHLQAVIAASVLASAVGLALIVVTFGMVLSHRRMARHTGPAIPAITKTRVTMDVRPASHLVSNDCVRGAALIWVD